MSTRTSTGTGAAPATTAAASGASTLLVADDGRHLAATWTEPPTGQAHAVAVISSAAGVPRGYYRAFAQWLAGRGYAVLCYDYRGIGGSRQPGPLRDDRACMRDWAQRDMSAALAAAEARRGGRGLPLLLVGHSFGGACIGFARGVEQADAILTVGSQLGEVRLFSGLHRLVVSGFFRVWLPLMTALFGHAPGWSLGPGAQALPAGVVRQWRQWGLRRDWAFGDPRMQPLSSYGAIVAPVHVWGISDDLRYAPPKAVDALAARYRNAALQRHTLTPADVGQRRLGHFGVFRREPGPRAWERLLAPIEAAVPAFRGPAG